MRVLFIFLCAISLTGNTLALEFSTLSKYKPTQISYTTANKTYVSFALKISPDKPLKSDLFIRVQYEIGSDTLNDYIYTDGEYDGIIKELFLDAGESVTVSLFLNNSGMDFINDLNGSIDIEKKEDTDVSSDEGAFHFVGSVWKLDESPIFRISKTDSEQKSLVLKFSLTENYEFDVLFIRAKIISPMQGILMLNKTVEVNNEAFLPYKGKTVEVTFPDLHMDKPGSYYVQLTHEHHSRRVNGIQSISWELR